MRLYEAAEGTILVGEEDLGKINVDEHRHSVAYVGQNPKLFDLSIAENIAYGMDPAPSQV
jgi:ABC-type multidrug transport system fused ATPase/permease subunit